MTKKLSKKQEKVLKLYLAGYKPVEIARIMKLHINIICCYKSIVMEKWEVENNIELVVEAVKRGYIEIEEEDEQTPVITYTYISKK